MFFYNYGNRFLCFLHFTTKCYRISQMFVIILSLLCTEMFAVILCFPQNKKSVTVQIPLEMLRKSSFAVILKPPPVRNWPQHKRRTSPDIFLNSTPSPAYSNDKNRQKCSCPATVQGMPEPLRYSEIPPRARACLSLTDWITGTRKIATIPPAKPLL